MWDLLRELMPVFASLAIKDEQTRLLVTRLIDVGQREVERRMNQTGKTRAEALAEFGAKWDENVSKLEALKNRPDNRE